MNIDVIKSETEEYYKSEGKEGYFKEKVNNLKSDILQDFQKWKLKNQGKNFSNFKNECLEDLKQGMQYLDQIQYIGIFITALDEITENNL